MEIIGRVHKPSERNNDGIYQSEVSLEESFPIIIHLRLFDKKSSNMVAQWFQGSKYESDFVTSLMLTLFG
jgi:hypothetical protein